MSKDYEKQIEDAFLAILADNGNLSSYTFHNWQDASKKRSYPAILAHCSGTAADPGTPQGELQAAFVEIGAQTHVPKDKSRSVLNSIISEIRTTLSDSALITSLNNKVGSALFIAVVNAHSQYESDSENIHKWQTTLECHIYS